MKVNFSESFLYAVILLTFCLLLNSCKSKYDYIKPAEKGTEIFTLKDSIVTIANYKYYCDPNATSSISIVLSNGGLVTAKGISKSELTAILQLVSRPDIKYNTYMRYFTNSTGSELDK